MKRTIGGVALLTVLAVASNGFAQTAGPVTNVSSVVRGGVVTVSYDLVSTQPAAMFSVTLEASSDAGKTYTVRPKTVKGDIGPSVRGGTGKQVTWEAARDVESLEIDRYRYRVVAQLVTAQGLTPQPGQPPQQSAVAKKGGSGAKWGGIALMGAGGALAFFGATAKEFDEHCGCDVEKTNKALLYAGLGAAGGGVALMVLGRPNSSVRTGITVLPGGVMVQHRLPLK